MRKLPSAHIPPDSGGLGRAKGSTPGRAHFLRALFFCSGLVGLVYQVVWSRWLNEVFGVTVYAVTAVLITFLGGLALGGFVLGRVADRRKQPLAFFGALEVGVALAAVLGAWSISLLDPLHVSAARRFAPDSPLLLGARVLLAAIVIVPPTFLMGGTLPAMARVFTRRLGRLGRELSLLYAINTTGAVVGTLLAGFVVIRLLGLQLTLWLAASVNVLVGCAALLTARSQRLRDGRGAAAGTDASRAAEAAERDAAGALEEEPPVSRRPISIVKGRWDRTGLLVVMALSGFVSLGLEVLWTRALVLPLGTSTYAFVTMLSAFLIGLSLGGFLARAVLGRVRELRRLLGWLEIGIAATALATLPVIAYLGAGAWQRVLEGAEVGWQAFVGARFAVSFLVMLVPTTLIGMTFPIACAMWVQHGAKLGRGVGQVYAANTFGNILGAAATGFWLIPAIGIQRSVALLVTLNVLSAMWGFRPPASRRVPWRITEGTLVLAGACACLFVLVLFDPSPFLVHGEAPNDRTLYYREGVSGTVKVVERGDNVRQRLMAIDGIKIGESYGGVDAKQQALAHFPFLIASDHEIRSVLTVGLGTGILAGEVARHASVESVVCLEISASVIEASRLFDEWNGRVVENDRVRIINDDGFTYLKRTGSSYDAIISDAKSRAGHAANALFFSTDYYDLCRRRLATGGLMIQWVPLAVPGVEFRTILRTFAGAFPDIYVWIGNDSCFLVGREAPARLDLPHIREEIQRPAARNLTRYGWGDAYGFASMLIADRASMRGLLARENAVNSLDRPVLEFYALGEFEEAPSRRRSANMLDLLAARCDPCGALWVGSDPDSVRINRRAAALIVEGAARLDRGGADFAEGLALLRQAVALVPGSAMAREEAGRATFEAALIQQRLSRPRDAVALYRESSGYRPDHAYTFNNLGGALGRIGALEEAIEKVQRAVLLNPGFAGAHDNLGRLLAGAGRSEEAVEAFRAAIDIDPSLVSAHRNLAAVLLSMGDRPGADRHREAAERLSRR